MMELEKNTKDHKKEPKKFYYMIKKTRELI